jgi:predicted dehydrogenase
MPQSFGSGIIGNGFMGRVHAAAVRAAGGRVVAACGSPGRDATEIQAQLGAKRTVSSVEALLEQRDIDVVHVCTPNSTHVEFAAAALAAGKHVICEKPLATELGDAAELTRMAPELVKAVPFVYRYYPTVRDAQRLARSGGLGQLHSIYGQYLQDWLADETAVNWRTRADLGGRSRAFGDIGIHWCDLAEFVTGQRIVRLVSKMATVHDRGGATEAAGPRTEDTALVLFETDGGAHGSVVVSQVSWGNKNSLRLAVDGTSGSVMFDQEDPDHLWRGERGGWVRLARGASPVPGFERHDQLPPGHPMGYQDCFSALVADVYQAISGEPPAGLPTFDDALRAARLVEAVLESAKTDSWVEILE